MLSTLFIIHVCAWLTIEKDLVNRWMDGWVSSWVAVATTEKNRSRQLVGWCESDDRLRLSRDRSLAATRQRLLYYSSPRRPHLSQSFRFSSTTIQPSTRTPTNCGIRRNARRAQICSRPVDSSTVVSSFPVRKTKYHTVFSAVNTTLLNTNTKLCLVCLYCHRLAGFPGQVKFKLSKLDASF